jgi:hypothetical protein
MQNYWGMHYKKFGNSGRFQTIHKLQKTVWKKVQTIFSGRFQTVHEFESLIRVMDGLGQTVCNSRWFGPNRPENYEGESWSLGK